MIIFLFKNCVSLQQFYISIESLKQNMFNKKYFAITAWAITSISNSCNNCKLYHLNPNHNHEIFPFLMTMFKNIYLSWQQSYSAPVKKDWMRIILFTDSKRLRWYIILCILLVPITFVFQESIHYSKSEYQLPKNFFYIGFIEGPLKMMKNAFYSILKALSFSRYLRFCHHSLVMLKKWLD